MNDAKERKHWVFKRLAAAWNYVKSVWSYVKNVRGLIAAIFFLVGFTTYLATPPDENIGAVFQSIGKFCYDFAHNLGLFLAAVVAMRVLYDVFIKKKEQEELLAVVTREVRTTIDQLLPAFQKWGFQGFQDKLDFNEIFDKLVKGDELLWLDTYSAHRSLVADRIIRACGNEVTVRLLAIDQGSVTAKWRASEIVESGYTEDVFLTDVKSFVEVMHEIEKICNKMESSAPDAVTPHASASDHASPQTPASDAAAKTLPLEVRMFRDLPCVPMYLIVRNGKPYFGLTSYFLTHPSEAMAHARWNQSEEGMLKYFHGYFMKKWDKWDPKKSSPQSSLGRSPAAQQSPPDIAMGSP